MKLARHEQHIFRRPHLFLLKFVTSKNPLRQLCHRVCTQIFGATSFQQKSFVRKYFPSLTLRVPFEQNVDALDTTHSCPHKGQTHHPCAHTSQQKPHRLALGEHFHEMKGQRNVE